jgi:hypothetical protein
LTNFLPARASLVSTSTTQGRVFTSSNIVVAAFGAMPSTGVARLELRLRFTNSATLVATNRSLAISEVPELFPADDVASLAFTVWSDNDHDGLADDWEMEFFGSLAALNGGPGDDYDGDHLSNLQEFLAGTDPSDAANLLRITHVAASGGAVTIQFHAVTGVRYQLVCAPAIIGPWTPVGAVVPGEGRRVTLTGVAPESDAAWFVRLRQLP